MSVFLFTPINTFVFSSIIDNRLWRDEKRSLPIARPRFRAKVGWNDHVERVFAALGFPLDKLSQGDGKEEDALQPPPIDASSAEGKASRTKLLRAWVELSAWLGIYEKANSEWNRLRRTPMLTCCRGGVQGLQPDGDTRQGG
ncbi:hypothetical protein V8D89_008004 [Ganoderma adspersum]